MADIKLFSINQTVQEMESVSVAFEKELQILIEQNMPVFFGVTFLRTEYSITNGRIDSLGLDENNCPVIFEYKRSLNENVINQGLFYLNWLLDHKADFKLLVMETLGNQKAELIDWSMPCVICIASDFTKFDEHAVNQMQRNIKLVKYKKYGNEFIILEYLNAPKVKPAAIEESSEPVNKSSGKDKTFLQNLADASQDKQNLYYSIRDYILSLGDDIAENQLKLYVAFKKVKNFICVEVYKIGVVLYLKVKPHTVELRKGLIEDVSSKGHHGTGELRLILKSINDFEAVKHLLDRAYNEN